MKKHGFSFIFPVHNEELILISRVKLFIQLLKNSRIEQYEIILIENGSTDSSWRVIRSLSREHTQIRGLQIYHASYGRAIQHGILSAQYRQIFIQDVDFFSISFVIQSVKLLRTNCLVIGSKNLRASTDLRPTLDRLRSKVFIASIKLLFKYPGSDTNGIKAMRNTRFLVKIIRQCYTKYELFDTELVLRIHNTNHKIAELPVTVIDIRPSRYSKFRRWTLLFRDVVRICSFHIFRDYNRFPSVVADDFGLTSKVSHSIIAQCAAKNIQIVSVMSNLVSKKDAKLLTECRPSPIISLHLNLLSGRPVSRLESVQTLTNSGGEFISLPRFVLRLLLHRVALSEIELELANQFKLLTKIKLKPSLIDSEQHIHTLEPVRQVVNNFAVKQHLRVRSVSSTTNYLIPRMPKIFIYRCIEFLLKVRYPHSLINAAVKHYNATIVHPGSNYD